MRRGPLLLLCLGLGCAGAQWDSTAQIYAAGGTQVQVRNAQSRNFDDVEKRSMLEAVVASFQDLGFQIEVLDEELGIVSGKKFTPRKRRDVTYLLYDEESLVAFSKTYRSWGPFHRRSDLVRLTVTVRPGGGARLIVRASAQHELGPIESAEPYQAFFRTLEKSLFAARELEG